jgi:hypothetical protein
MVNSGLRVGIRGGRDTGCKEREGLEVGKRERVKGG